MFIFAVNLLKGYHLFYKTEKPKYKGQNLTGKAIQDKIRTDWQNLTKTQKKAWGKKAMDQEDAAKKKATKKSIPKKATVPKKQKAPKKSGTQPVSRPPPRSKIPAVKGKPPLFPKRGGSMKLPDSDKF